MRVQRDGTEYIWTWKQFKTEVFAFAKSLYKLGLKQKSVVNIMGFNSPEWVISFHGTYFINGISSGVYSTNGADACQYQTEHCQGEAIIVDTLAQFEQYVSVLHTLPKVKALVSWGLKELPPQYRNDPRFFTWDDFLQVGSDVPDATLYQMIAG